MSRLNGSRGPGRIVITLRLFQNKRKLIFIQTHDQPVSCFISSQNNLYNFSIKTSKLATTTYISWRFQRVPFGHVGRSHCTYVGRWACLQLTLPWYPCEGAKGNVTQRCNRYFSFDKVVKGIFVFVLCCDLIFIVNIVLFRPFWYCWLVSVNEPLCQGVTGGTYIMTMKRHHHHHHHQPIEVHCWT